MKRETRKQMIGKRIRTERLRRKLSITTLETLCNIPHGKLSRIENGRITLSVYYIPKLSQMLEIPQKDLCPYDDFQYQPMGVKISYYRKLKGLTQYELAQATGISSSTIGHIESLDRIPREQNLEKISDALGIRISKLYNHN